jgi:hypothetical protein
MAGFLKLRQYRKSKQKARPERAHLRMKMKAVDAERSEPLGFVLDGDIRNDALRTRTKLKAVRRRAVLRVQCRTPGQRVAKNHHVRRQLCRHGIALFRAAPGEVLADGKLHGRPMSVSSALHRRNPRIPNSPDHFFTQAYFPSILTKWGSFV